MSNDISMTTKLKEGFGQLDLKLLMIVILHFLNIHSISKIILYIHERKKTLELMKFQVT